MELKWNKYSDASPGEDRLILFWDNEDPDMLPNDRYEVCIGTWSPDRLYFCGIQDEVYLEDYDYSKMYWAYLPENGPLE